MDLIVICPKYFNFMDLYIYICFGAKGIVPKLNFIYELYRVIKSNACGS